METLRELAFLQRLSLTAAQTLDTDALVQLVIDETTGALGVDVCSVYLVEPPGNQLVLSATNGLSQAGVGHVRLRVGQGITGWAAQDRKPIVIADVREERRFVWLHGVDQDRFVSMCSVPILSADRLVGVLNVQTDERRVFQHNEVDFLVAIAAQVAGVLERSAVQERLEEHIRELHRSEQIHRRFTALSLEGAGLEQICTAIAEQLDGAVALYDDDGICRVRSHGADDLPDRTYDLPEPSERLAIHPVRAGESTMGSLVVAVSEPPDAVSARAVEHGVTVIALELARERTALAVEQRLHGDVIEELLSGDLPHAEVRRLADRAARLGIGLRRRMWVVVIRADDDGAMRAFTDPDGADRMLRAVVDRVRPRHQGAVAVERNAALIVLVPEPAAVDHVERAGEILLAELQGAFADGRFSIGISGASMDAAGLHRGFSQAELAIAVGRRVAGPGHVNSYRRFGAERILFAAAEQTDLGVFVDEWLGSLIRQPESSRAAAPLLETVEALCACGWSMRAAARHLAVEMSVLEYRVQRARIMCGRDLDDPDVRLSLTLALRARAMLDAGPSGRPPEDSPAGDPDVPEVALGTGSNG